MKLQTKRTAKAGSESNKLPAVTKHNPRGKGKSIQYHLTVLGADSLLPWIYLPIKHSVGRYSSIYDRHETCDLLWAVKTAFRTNLKKAKTSAEMRRLIESHVAALRILKHHE